MQNQHMWLKQQNCLKILVKLTCTKKSHYSALIQSHLPEKTSVGGSKICFALFNCLILETLFLETKIVIYFFMYVYKVEKNCSEEFYKNVENYLSRGSFLE